MLKISQLIARLEELKDRHGDLPVWRYDRGEGPFPVESVEFLSGYLAHEFTASPEQIPDRIELN